jgi:hypothetical protein
MIYALIGLFAGAYVQRVLMAGAALGWPFVWKEVSDGK